MITRMDLVIFEFVDMLRFGGNSGLGLGFGDSGFKIRNWRLRYIGQMKAYVLTTMNSIDNRREEVLKEDVGKEGALYYQNVFFLFLLFLPTKLYTCGLFLDIYGVTSSDMWCMLQGLIQLYRHLKSDLGQSHQIASMYVYL